MGCGKSTVGKRLANRLHLTFLDLDSSIEKNYRQPISSIFANKGEEKFRELEHDCLKTILEQDDYVLALGGGTPCFYDNMELINKSGSSIYIQMSVKSLADRLIHAKRSRPLIEKMTEKEMQEYISSHLPIRENYYLKAHYTVKGEDLNIEELESLIRSFS